MKDLEIEKEVADTKDMPKTQEVAQMIELCPVCNRPMQGPILVNTIHSVKRAAAIKKFEGHVLDYCQEVCSQCAKQIGDNVAVVAVDSKRVVDGKPERVGKASIITKEDLNEEVLKELEDRNYLFLDFEEGLNMGFFVSEGEDKEEVLKKYREEHPVLNESLVEKTKKEDTKKQKDKERKTKLGNHFLKRFKSEA